MNTAAQVTAFADRYQSAETVTVKPGEAEVIFPSALELDREQEERMMTTALDRKAKLEWELGLGDVENLENSGSGRGWEGSDITKLTDSFFGRRHLYDLIYRMEMEWRQYLRTPSGDETIFFDHNIHIPHVRRIVQQQISRAQGYNFATDPWFALEPQGRLDTEAAEKLDRYSKFKAKQANLKAVLSKAIELAFIRGEAVVKSTYRREDDYYKAFAEVAIDPETDEPLVANDGDYIFDDDEWVAEADPETGELVRDDEQNINYVLKRDPSTGRPESLTFDRRKVDRLVNQFAGAELESVYYSDLLIPKAARSVQDADCVVHTFEVPAIELAQMYLKRGLNPEEHPRFIELLREISGDAAQPRTTKHTARQEEGETHDATLGASGEPMVRIGEFYLKMDVDGDGLMENIMLVVDLDNKTPIFYDYLANITPDGRRPFHVVRVNPVDGRWYGTSQVKLFYDLQMFCDTLTARWDMSQSNSARVDVINRSVVEEGDEDPNLEVNGGDIFHAKQGKDPKDFIYSHYLTDIKSGELQRQIEFVQQIMTTMSGVTNANDAAMADLDTTKLATGVRNIEKSGQELFAPLLSHLEVGIADAMKGFLLQTIHNMAEVEVFDFFEGGVRQLDEIKPATAKAVEFVVSMEMTRYKGEQELIQGMQSVDLIERFFAMLPEIQEVVQPVFISLGKLFGMKDADQVFIPGTAPPAMPGQPMDPQAAMGAVGDSQPAQPDPNL